MIPSKSINKMYKQIMMCVELKVNQIKKNTDGKKNHKINNLRPANAQCNWMKPKLLTTLTTKI